MRVSIVNGKQIYVYIYTHDRKSRRNAEKDLNVKETPVFPQAPVNFYDCTYVHEPPPSLSCTLNGSS